MIDRARTGVSGLSPSGEWLFATVFWIAALAILALALGLLPFPIEKLPAPRWLIGVAALLFIAAGCALSYTLNRGQCWSNSTFRSASWKESSASWTAKRPWRALPTTPAPRP